MTHRITLTADRVPAVTDEGDGGYPATLQGPVQAELVRRFDNGIIGAYIVDEDGEGYTASIAPGKYVNEALPDAPAELPTDRVTVHGPYVSSRQHAPKPPLGRADHQAHRQTANGTREDHPCVTRETRHCAWSTTSRVRRYHTTTR